MIDAFQLYGLVRSGAEIPFEDVVACGSMDAVVAAVWNTTAHADAMLGLCTWAGDHAGAFRGLARCAGELASAYPWLADAFRILEARRAGADSTITLPRPPAEREEHLAYLVSVAVVTAVVPDPDGLRVAHAMRQLGIWTVRTRRTSPEEVWEQHARTLRGLLVVPTWAQLTRHR